jgi:DNA invertase Pin-like site-specific DNA recombinase
MPTAIAYQRWSTPDQAAGDSKKRQDDLVSAYCEEKGLTLLDTHIDAGISSFRGSNAMTGNLRLLMVEIASGRLKVDFILIETFDRMSRDTAIDAIELLSAIVKLGPTVVTLTDRQEYSRKSLRENPMQIMWATVQMMRSHDESLMKSRRAKSAWTSKRSNALSKPMTAKGPPWLKLDKASGQFLIITDKAQVVRDIYNMAAKGSSIEGIAKHLNLMKVPPITEAKFWYRQQVLRILKTKAVIGIHEPMQVTYERDAKDNLKKVKTPEAEIPNYYPPIIDEELANKVWSLNKTRSKFRATGQHTFITGGLAKCWSCGGSMTYNMKPKYQYLVCANSRVKACPEVKLIKYDWIEGYLKHNLYDILEQHSLKSEGSEITNLKTAMDDIEAGIGRLVDAIRLRGFDGSVGAALDSLEEQRKALTLEMIEASQKASKSVLEANIENLKNSLLFGATISEINLQMRLVMKSLVINPYQHVIIITFVDGSRAFMAIDADLKARRAPNKKRLP